MPIFISMVPENRALHQHQFHWNGCLEIVQALVPVYVPPYTAVDGRQCCVKSINSWCWRFYQTSLIFSLSSNKNTYEILRLLRERLSIPITRSGKGTKPKRQKGQGKGNGGFSWHVGSYSSTTSISFFYQSESVEISEGNIKLFYAMILESLKDLWSIVHIGTWYYSLKILALGILQWQACGMH